jgi:activator of 2-hydroxyglutaryl-CoA dehydratase/predicted nucleotide-binding protein (sugar kinase/HSP70/actin superfamily)
VRERYVGIDIGAETVKLVELTAADGELRLGRKCIVEHDKQPARVLVEQLQDWDWESVTAACVVGRASRLAALPRVPAKQAQAKGFRYLQGDRPATIVSIGSHGFSVLELRPSGVEVFRENSRCSQGTGNFLRQLVERFDMTIEHASDLCEQVPDPAPLSGRCPVILKTDMTHLANKGESRARILAGLYDAVCENVQVLIKPNVSPKQVVLTGGVSRAVRVRDNFRAFLAGHDMELVPTESDDALYFEAIGAAIVALEQPTPVPSLRALIAPPVEADLDELAPLSAYLPKVHRLRREKRAAVGDHHELLLGFDIGSTGSKVVALDRTSGEPLWEGYVNTNGSPVGAAQDLVRQFIESEVRNQPVYAFGATGSGREIVGSLLSTCFGVERVYVLNEIAAHAEGALHHDASVDTIFEIGGQDAKYIRLAEGRVVDAAMNEACSAGTGSFIEEQGRKFSGIRDVVHLGEQALCADGGVSLGQHCSVFMAEIIDEAVAQGVDNSKVIAGIYGSVIQNYMNRVKGSRSVGDVVFCQGMPFAADALAAAVARETGSKVIVPPNPGTVGALGIALLTRKSLGDSEIQPLDVPRFLDATVSSKDTFVCKSTKGCGGAGNHCRIDRIATLVRSKRKRFTWGGSCSVWDKGTGKHKLPDLAPDPFREREALVAAVIERVTVDRGRSTIAITDEFQLKDLFPFFATFLFELGFDIRYQRSRGKETLKRGIEEANIPYCAPMQLYHGMLSTMSEEQPDFLFTPMLRQMPRSGDEDHAVACPIVQGSPDIMRLDLNKHPRTRLLSPVIDFGSGNFDSKAIMECCRKLALSVGKSGLDWWSAYQEAKTVQERFAGQCIELGRSALAFCREHDIVAVVTLGRPYTLYNEQLNSHVPPLLREQGAMAIPIDCYPVERDVPTVDGLYWGHGQRNLRAAHQIRRTEGVYSIWCSNYSCGPDSFNLHFYAYAMQGKPFAVIETDGHSGDAGTKTRVEAFLHCVREDRAHDDHGPQNDLRKIARRPHGLEEIRRRGEHVLVPRMGPGAEVLSSCLRGIGVSAEALPRPDAEALRIGRRYTSGKECAPMWITLGSLLQRLDREQDPTRRFAFFMPTANGPCRFGVYNFLHRIVLERTGHEDRVQIWSPEDSDYFEGVPAGFTVLVQIGFSALDWLLEGLYHSRPVEHLAGDAQQIYDRFSKRLFQLLERAGRGDLSLAKAMLQVASGRLFGVTALLHDAAEAYANVKTERVMPTVVVVGEIYVRCDPFANDYVIDKLEARGLRARFAPFTEWLEYTDHVSRSAGDVGFAAQLTSLVQRRIQNHTYTAMAKRLDWPPRTTVEESIRAARPYVREDLEGEAILTVGGPVHEWREGLIDGVVSIGPHECMPNKISEAQFFHVAEREGLASLTVPVNGDPIDPEIIDTFAFEVKARFDKRLQEAGAAIGDTSRRRLSITP